MARPIKKLLVANRSEIAIRVFRSAHELGIRTVAIYAHEDRFALHRFKADESYLVGRAGEPIRSYLDFEGIVALAKAHGVDAIHPGYGFLSENPEFAAACLAAGITFVGPRVELLETLGDKTAARDLAKRAGVPILAGSSQPVTSQAEALRIAKDLGWPVMIKAAHGGGGRGMRVVRGEDELAVALESAQRESQTAFGSAKVFVEKFIQHARHIEVQLLGDMHGGLVHLFERDCSVQRRHQKVVEVAPAPNLDPGMRKEICDAALAIGRTARYENAGTVEFLVDTDTGRFYFIEVNPRIQVEHTVTEEITGIDIVRRQIRVAEGYRLADPQIGLGNQDAIGSMGTAIQCRVTTEDPENRFLPDYGRMTAYRSASGMGIRLDAGTAFSGAVVTPYFDSLLVKVTARGLSLDEAAGHIERCLQEFRVRGVKTNIPFLINLVTHPEFLAGRCTTRFIDETPALFDFPIRRDRATRLLEYLADTIVNGNPLVKGRPAAARRTSAPIPEFDRLSTPPAGTKTRLQELGPEKFAGWVRDQKGLMVTDTTMRDAHQSLLATRMRSFDMLAIADAYARMAPGLFSLEMWGGATFDTSMRFLKEDPWDRLARLRERIPNILFQMLLRASNAVGYTNYPDNVVTAFVKESAAAGIDVFRVFDPLNWVPNMQVAMDAVRDAGGICEAAICYTGDVLDPTRKKFSLAYYVDLARQLEKRGAHMLAVKDMAGLCKPYAAATLVKALHEAVGIPIHFHTHDTSAAALASELEAARNGVSIVDAAMAPFSGPPHPARHRPRPRAAAASGPVLVGRPRALHRLRVRHEGPRRRSLPPRDAGGAVHEPPRAGQGPRSCRPLGGCLPRLRRRQHAPRRHHQGDADEQGGGRSRDAPCHQRPPRLRSPLRFPRDGLPRVGRRSAVGPNGPTAGGLSRGGRAADRPPRRAGHRPPWRIAPSGRLQGGREEGGGDHRHSGDPPGGTLLPPLPAGLPGFCPAPLEAR